MRVTEAVKTRVQAKIAEGIALAEAAYNITVRPPRVVYNKRGTTAGTANYREWVINLNPVLLMENIDTFIDRTVPHELAHLVVYQVYPEAYQTELVRTRTGYKRTKRDVHGSYWQEVMRKIGANDNRRCHSYDTTNSKVKKTVTKYEYRCTGCQQSMMVSAKRHSQLSANPRAVYHSACGRGSKLELVQTATPARPAAAAKETAPKVPTTGSKMDRCYGWYKHYKDAGTVDLRQMCIAVFIQEVGMTKAGASTYYSNCQKLDK